MKQEIGGYLELEVFHGKEYYPDLVKVNLGRTALCWLLESRKIETLYLPFFLCDSVIDACRRQGTHVNFYSLNEDLTPVLPPDLSLHPGEYLYLVNYYGQLTDEKILYYKKYYKNIIVDHTHAFFQHPLPGVDTLYSCRKFFGLSDGAYLSTDATLTAGKEQDVSAERMGHILGRFEKDAGTYYQKMLDNAATYHHMEILTMSRLTQNLLKAIDYEQIRQKRNENYRFLKELLPSDSPFTRVTPDGPFAYPYYHKNGIALRKALAKEKVFVPTNWSNVIRDCAPESYEYQWAADILPLPCDQRYGNEEMQRIADVIHALEP